MAVHHEAGVEGDELVSGIDHAADRQQECARGARGHQHLAVGVVKLAVDGRLDLIAQLGDALGYRIGISTGLDGVDRGDS